MSSYLRINNDKLLTGNESLIAVIYIIKNKYKIFPKNFIFDKVITKRFVDHYSNYPQRKIGHKGIKV